MNSAIGVAIVRARICFYGNTWCPGTGPMNSFVETEEDVGVREVADTHS